MVNTITPEVVRLYNLLKDYSSLMVDAQVTEAVVEQWLQEFDLVWISHAVTEALYQGRYKLVSIEQILRLWQRRGHPIRHFNREFETLILGQTLLCCPEAPDPEVSKTLLPPNSFLAIRLPIPSACPIAFSKSSYLLRAYLWVGLIMLL